MPHTPDEELVRRLLADARHDAPVPADVAARLDGVLDELASERRAVTALRAGTARRRRWGAALVAAAAFTVAGVTAHAWWPQGGGSSTSGSTSSTDSSAGKASGGSASAPGVGAGGAVELHRATLAADVRRVLSQHRGELAPLSPTSGAAPDLLGCGSSDQGPGRAVAAHLDGEPAVLVLRPPVGGHEVADVLSCGTARVLASVTIPLA